MAEKIITIEAKAWIIKYFRADSTEYLFFFDKIKGIKDKRLTSSPSQAINHEFAEIEIRIEMTKDIKKSTKAG
jgi:hypothetical protein